MTGVRVLHGYTRDGAGELTGYFDAEHLAAAMPDARRRFRLRAARARGRGPGAVSRRANPRASSRRCSAMPAESSGGRVSFTDSGVEVTDDGRPLLQQAEDAGLTPESGCRMGICHTCTRRKTRGAVKNLITGAVSTTDEEDVQICVSAPVGDVELAL